MARPLFPNLVTNHFQSSLPLITIAIFASIFALVALCARHGRSSTKSRKSPSRYQQQQAANTTTTATTTTTTATSVYKTPPRSPLASPRKFFSNITANNNNKVYNNMSKIQENDVMVLDDQNEGFGEGGVWQKNILMGEKCQPLEFSGVIYYDSCGNVVSQPPRSPRVSIAASLQGSMSSLPVSSRSSIDLINH